MRAVTWQGVRDVRVDSLPEPTIHEPTDAIVRVTSTALCGSDLHLYEVLGAFMSPGDVLGHEVIGIVEEVGPALSDVAPGDRVVVPFNIACGTCFMCRRGLQSQCETTQVRHQGMGAAIYGYSRLYGQVPGGQAGFLRVPHAGHGLVKVPPGPADDRFVYLSDVLPTAWQAVEYTSLTPGQSLVVVGLGPIGLMSCRIARQRGMDPVIGIDRVPDRLTRAAADGVTVLHLGADGDLRTRVLEMTDGRGADAAIDAVGMEAHGAPLTATAQRLSRLLPDRLEAAVLTRAGIDRLSALHLAIELVRRGGTLSIAGVYGGMLDPMPMLTLFDRQVTIRMGQANVRRWTDDILPLLLEDVDPLGTETFASHHLSIEDAPDAYRAFQRKEDGTFKVLFQP